MLFSELRSRDVINMKDCKKLGRVCDVDFNECDGRLEKIVVSGGNCFTRFLRCEPDIVICYREIRQIGPDIILVDINV